MLTHASYKRNRCSVAVLFTRMFCRFQHVSLMFTLRSKVTQHRLKNLKHTHIKNTPLKHQNILFFSVSAHLFHRTTFSTQIVNNAAETASFCRNDN